jgi:hypothetical protein
MFREKTVPRRSRKNVVGLKLEVKHVEVFELAAISTYNSTPALTYSTPAAATSKVCKKETSLSHLESSYQNAGHLMTQS